MNFILIVFQILSSINLVGSLNCGDAKDLFVTDSYAFVASMEMGLNIIDIADPTSPQKISQVFLPGNAYSVYLHESYAFVTTLGNPYLCIINISNPSTPYIQSYISTQGDGYNVRVLGDYAYVVTNHGLMLVYDISNISNPVNISSVNTTSSAVGISLSGNYAFVAAGGFDVIDITNPYSPQKIYSYITPGYDYAYDICIDSNNAYIAYDDYDDDMKNDSSNFIFQKSNIYNKFENGGLRIYDITNPISPTLSGYCYTSPNSFGVCYASKHAFVTGYEYGFYAVDVSNTSNPFLVESYTNTIGNTREIYIQNGLIYTANGSGGLGIYSYSGLDQIAPIIDSTTLWTDTTIQGPFPVYTFVTDNMSLNEVKLFYKRIEDPIFNSLEMVDSGNNWFYAEIPQAYISNDTIKYYIYSKDNSNNESTDPANAPGNFYSFIAYCVSVEENHGNIDNSFSINYSYNNNRNIDFELSIPENTYISLKIFDLSGRIISDLYSNYIDKGVHNFNFKPVSNGVYYYIIESPSIVKSDKFIIF